MHKPLLSVVVPCFNAEMTVKKTLLSVAAQMEQYPNCEVIMVDDGSTDRTPDIIRQFELWDKRFKSVRQGNGGVSAARNKGVEIAGGKYIAFLDADDLFLGNCVSERMKVLLDEDNQDLLGAFCPAVFIDSEGNVILSSRMFEYSVPHNRLYYSSTPESVFNPSCLIAKKEELLKAGGFDESIANGEDYDLWHKMMRSGGYFRLVLSCSIGWRQHSSSAAHSKILTHYRRCKQVTGRIFEESTDNSAEVFRGGYGSSVYHFSVTSRAFSTSIMALIAGQYEDAVEISRDIKKIMIEQITTDRLKQMIKFNGIRAMCKPDDQWNTILWPMVKDRVISFISEINERLGGNCNSLMLLRHQLQDDDVYDFDMKSGKEPVAEGEANWRK